MNQLEQAIIDAVTYGGRPMTIEVPEDAVISLVDDPTFSTPLLEGATLTWVR